MGIPETIKLPFVYLGTEGSKLKPSFGYNNRQYRFASIKGGTFDERVISEFENALTSDSYTVLDTGKKNDVPSKSAYKMIKDTDTDKVEGCIRACIYRSNSIPNGNAVLEYYYDDYSAYEKAVDVPHPL